MCVIVDIERSVCCLYAHLLRLIDCAVFIFNTFISRNCFDGYFVLFVPLFVSIRSSNVQNFAVTCNKYQPHWSSIHHWWVPLWILFEIVISFTVMPGLAYESVKSINGHLIELMKWSWNNQCNGQNGHRTLMKLSVQQFEITKTTRAEDEEQKPLKTLILWKTCNEPMKKQQTAKKWGKKRLIN